MVVLYQLQMSAHTYITGNSDTISKYLKTKRRIIINLYNYKLENQDRPMREDLEEESLDAWSK